jgi:hypothetical protein
VCGTIPATSVTHCPCCQPVWQRLHFLQLASSGHCGTLEKAASMKSYVRVADAVLTSTHLKLSSCFTYFFITKPLMCLCWEISLSLRETNYGMTPTKTRTVEAANSVWTTYVGVKTKLRGGGPGGNWGFDSRQGQIFFFPQQRPQHPWEGPSQLTRICGAWIGRGVTLVIHLTLTPKVRMRRTTSVISYVLIARSIFNHRNNFVYMFIIFIPRSEFLFSLHYSP